MTFWAGTTWPAGVLSSTSPTSAISSRSASRSRTTTGYSLPRSRNCAAVVPATLVWIVLATLCTRHAEHRAFGRSTRMAISGRPSSRPTLTSAMPGVSSISVARILRHAPGVVEVVAADFERQAAA